MGQTLVMGGGYWAIGATLAEAKRKFTAFGGRLSYGYGIFVFDEATTFEGIDFMGQVHYVGNSPTFSEVNARKVSR